MMMRKGLQVRILLMHELFESIKILHLPHLALLDYAILLLLLGGRHGYGAKLTNIFSKEFSIETMDSRRKLLYKQSWYDNMTRASSPEITKIDAKSEDYTCITFVPDMFRLTGDPDASVIDDQDYAVMCRRVLDAAGCAAGRSRTGPPRGGPPACSASGSP